MKAAIFDMDGLLIDSEPFWRYAEKKVFALLGITITDDHCVEMTGRRIDEVVAYWFKKRPWLDKSTDQVVQEILTGVMELVEARGTALEGVYEVLEILRCQRLKIGLASSSPLPLIEAVVRKLNIGRYFDVVCSAKDEEFGKPHPAVYLTTANRLNVHSGDCVVFEDSLAGVQSAKSAGMVTIAVPAAEQYDDTKFEEADFKLRSLSEFKLDLIHTL